MKDFLIKQFSHVRWVHRLLSRLGYQLVMIGTEFPDVPESHKVIYRKVRPFTMTSESSVYTLLQCVEYLHLNRIPGSIVECGVWRGGMVMSAAQALLSLESRDRDLYLYDTFEGMVEPGEHDGEKATRLYKEYRREDGTTEWCRGTLDEVAANVNGCGYPINKVHYVKGKVEDTIPKTLPAQIALLRLDTDWYESTRHEFVHLFPLVSPGGVVIIDDYGAWKGSRKATDEYLAEKGLKVFLHRVDSTSRLFIKP